MNLKLNNFVDRVNLGYLLGLEINHHTGFKCSLKDEEGTTYICDNIARLDEKLYDLVQKEHQEPVEMHQYKGNDKVLVKVYQSSLHGFTGFSKEFNENMFGKAVSIDDPEYKFELKLEFYFPKKKNNNRTLEGIYHLMNTDSGFIRTVMNANECTSLSMGNVVEMENKLYYVDEVGFTPLESNRNK